jgi:hypothetical protein
MERGIFYFTTVPWTGKLTVALQGGIVDAYGTTLRKIILADLQVVISDKYSDRESSADGMGSHYSQRQAGKRWP